VSPPDPSDPSDPSDPLGRLARLPAVAEAVQRSRAAMDALLAHRFMRTDAAAVTLAAAERAASASALLDGGELLSAAMTVHAQTAALASTWGAAPRQALARMHVLASDPGVDPAALGRPRESLEVSARLDGLLRAITTTGAPAVVVAGVVHAEVLALQVFGSRDGLVARAAARAVLVSSGYDPRALLPFEVGYDAPSYAAAVQGYVAGDALGWLVSWCDALVAAAQDSRDACGRLRAARG
jgi:hypothetical protein